jgi:hypothetical protein
MYENAQPNTNTGLRFEVDDYDIRFYQGNCRGWFFEMNTFPNLTSILSILQRFLGSGPDGELTTIGTRGLGRVNLEWGESL